MKNLRRKRLIKPRLQARLIGSFVGLSLLAMLLQFLYLGSRLSAAAERLPDGGAELSSEIPGLLLGVLVPSLALFLPIVFLFGVRITFRIAGPIYRFERFLTDVADGKESKPCKIRDGDELQELCEIVNRATERPRAQNAERMAGADGTQVEAKAA